MQSLSLSLDSFTTFGDLLRYLRQREKLTQRELSIAVGYSESQINRLEKNLRLPEASIVAAQFIPALHLDDEPEIAARLIELVAQARGELMPASLNFTFTRSTQREVTETGALPRKRQTNLPVQLTRFIGRQDELGELATRAKTARLLTLTGAGGVGKTRLALEVASTLIGAFPEGVWLVEFAPLTDASLVAQAVAGVLGVTEQPGTPLEDALLASLRDRHALLLFDNCEHLVAACAALAERLLHACPGLHILATSREPLRIAGEVTWRVPSLRMPDPQGTPPLEALRESEAVQLFVERARANQPKFEVTADNAGAIAHICHRLDGIPLAIELAAARMNTLSVEQIADKLDDRFGLLTSGSRTALPRHQTLRATLAWSVDLLSPPEHRLFSQVSVFSGGFTAEAVAAVSDQPDAFDLLSNLVDKSLVIAEMDSKAARYQMLETIQQFAAEMLRLRASDASEEHALRRRHLGFYLALAEMAESKLHTGRAAYWLDRLEAEHHNLRAAIDWAFESGETTSGLCLVGALYEFWEGRNHFQEQREQLSKALAKSNPAERTAVRAKVLNIAGVMAWFYRNHDEVRGLLDEALSIGVELNDQASIALSLFYLGWEAQSHEDYPTARSLMESALDIWRKLGDKVNIAFALIALAAHAERQDDIGRARSLLEEALSPSTALEDKNLKARSLHRLGRLVLYDGDHAAAAAMCRRSLKLILETGNKKAVASCLATFAKVSLVRGQRVAAAQLLGFVGRLLDELSIPLLHGDAVQYEHDLDVLRKQLGNEAFDAAQAEGRAMSFDQAIEYALAE